MSVSGKAMESINDMSAAERVRLYQEHLKAKSKHVVSNKRTPMPAINEPVEKISSEAIEKISSRDDTLNKEPLENIEPWTMFTAALLTPKIEPDDFDIPEASNFRENDLEMNNVSQNFQALDFVVPKVEPEESCDYNAVEMDLHIDESVCLMADRNYEEIALKPKIISLEEKIRILNRLENGEKIALIAKSLKHNKTTIQKIKRKEEEIRKRFSAGCPDRATRSRKTISLEEKIKILNRLRDGEGSSSVGKSLNLSEATIRTIKKNEDKIRRSVSGGRSDSAKRLSRSREIDLVKTEEALMIWFEDCADKKIPLSSNAIKQKALKIYQLLKHSGHCSLEEQNHSFVASDGWLHKLKKRFPLNCLMLQGELAAANLEAANRFTKELRDKVLGKNYSADQIFNADETAFHWKKMPSQTYLSQSSRPGFEDRLTLLMCSNASGDFMLKPLVINYSLNPPALKNKNLSQLPVLWRANPKAWMTRTIFDDWFHHCFLPSVENYLYEKGLDFKVLLLIDSAISHKDLSHPNVKIIFFPPNCSSFIQPLGQGVIHTFKANYIRQTFEIILSRLVRDRTKTLIEVWNEFSILDCIQIIASACSEIKLSTINACWKGLLPQIVQERNTVPSTVENYTHIINVAAHLISEGLEGICVQDVEELFQEPDLNDLELSEGELVELIEKQRSDVTSADNSENLSNGFVKQMSLADVQKGLDLARELENYFAEKDPSVFRLKKFKNELLSCLAPYRKLLAQLQS